MREWRSASGPDKKRNTDTLAASLGAEITRLRAEKGLSQVAFAHLLGYDERYLRQVERDEKSPMLRTLSAIADAFGISVSTLIRAQSGTSPGADIDVRRGVRGSWIPKLRIADHSGAAVILLGIGYHRNSD